MHMRACGDKDGQSVPLLEGWLAEWLLKCSNCSATQAPALPTPREAL